MKTSMQVKTYGTAGSAPVSSPKRVGYGGNTTCVRIFSECIPESMALVVDGGTGFLPMSIDVIGEHKKSGITLEEVIIFMSHYREDREEMLALASRYGIEAKVAGKITEKRDFTVAIKSQFGDGKIIYF